jgi:HEAT repeat protein
MMEGHLRAKEQTMARKYIARDPRTGKPIKMEGTTHQDVDYEPVKGRWSVLIPADVMSLAEGSLASRTVRWKGADHTLTRKDGVRALSQVPKGMILPAHKLLLEALEDSDPDIRIAALNVLPEFAVRRSDELFDWLSVLLDDSEPNVRKAASEALARAAPTFPSGVRSSLANELRSNDAQRRNAAWKGLEALTKTWPDVVAEHVDSLFLEPNLEIRRKAAKMLNTIVARKTSVVWDLVSWALSDEDAQVRRTVAKSLPRLAKQDVRMGTVFAERAIVDEDSEVRLAAIRTIEKLNRGHGRARDLIINGARSSDVRVRRSCIAMLPKLMTEEELRILVDDLLKTEVDEKLVQTLMNYRYDAMLEGSEAEKNAGLSPALPIPELDREVLAAEGKSLGMNPQRDASLPPGPPERSATPTNTPTPAPQLPSPTTSERRPTQDELMGYHDDDEDDWNLDEPYD